MSGLDTLKFIISEDTSPKIKGMQRVSQVSKIDLRDDIDVLNASDKCIYNDESGRYRIFSSRKRLACSIEPSQALFNNHSKLVNHSQCIDALELVRKDIKSKGYSFELENCSIVRADFTTQFDVLHPIEAYIQALDSALVNQKGFYAGQTIKGEYLTHRDKQGFIWHKFYNKTKAELEKYGRHLPVNVLRSELSCQSASQVKRVFGYSSLKDLIDDKNYRSIGSQYNRYVDKKIIPCIKSSKHTKESIERLWLSNKGLSREKVAMNMLVSSTACFLKDNGLSFDYLRQSLRDLGYSRYNIKKAFELFRSQEKESILLDYVASCMRYSQVA